jgi:acyl carrier protein
MDETRERLANCFRVVFPTLPPDAVYTASQSRLAEWDSVAAITLLNVLEDEFGVQLDLEVLPDLTTFDLVLDHLRRELGAGAEAGV